MEQRQAEPLHAYCSPHMRLLSIASRLSVKVSTDKNILCACRSTSSFQLTYFSISSRYSGGMYSSIIVRLRRSSLRSCLIDSKRPSTSLWCSLSMSSKLFSWEQNKLSILYRNKISNIWRQKNGNFEKWEQENFCCSKLSTNLEFSLRFIQLIPDPSEFLRLGCGLFLQRGKLILDFCLRCFFLLQLAS